VGARAANEEPRTKSVIALGLPVAPLDDRSYDFGFLQSCTKPKLFISGDRDQFGPRAELEKLVAILSEPKKLIIVEGADHFFEGRMRELRETIEAWLRELLST